MTEQAQLTPEQMREIHQAIPVVLSLNLNQVNDILGALSKAPLEFAYGPTQLLTNMTVPQVQTWEAQQASKMQAEQVTDVVPKQPDEAV